MNAVILIGRLTRDPELSHVGDNIPKCEFGIAVDRSYGKDEVDFFDVTCWRGLAETVEKYCSKGKEVGVRGRLQQDRWTTKEGENRRKVSVVAEEVQFLGGVDNQEDDFDAPF